MFDLPLDTNITYSIVLATNNSSDFTWIFFIVILIISGLILGALLISFSNNPTDWEHLVLTDDYTQGGRLNNIAKTIEYSSTQGIYWPIKNQIETLFLEKVRATRGMTTEQIYNMKNRDPNKLRSIIHNKEISDWIFNVKEEEKKGFFDFLTRNKEVERQKNLAKIHSILDKMEAWGE
jgi:hypothetical protein